MTHNLIEILLVEDNPADVDLTCEVLAQWKLANHISVARDGVEAMKILCREPPFTQSPRPDLILLDLNLPKKDGREVLKEIKSNSILKTIPVVILTTSDTEIDVLKSYGLGANCYVTKPVGLDAFIKIVQMVGDFWLSVVKLPDRDLLSGRQPDLKNTICPEVVRQWKVENVVSILLIEDNPADVDFVKEILKDCQTPQIKCESVSRLNLGIERLKESKFDIVITDLGLPDSQGIQTFSTLQSYFPDVPFIILSGIEDAALAKNAVRAGAQDYIVKTQIDPHSLSRIIQHAIERKWAEVERRNLLVREQAARADAERAILARDEFLSIASHELKTPITSLVMQMQLLQRMYSNSGTPSLDEISLERNRKLLKSAENEMSRLAKLIETLLDVSKIGAGRLALKYEEFNLCDLIQEVVDRMQDQIRNSGSILQLDIKLPIVGQWDHFRIEQILINLLSNAIKYGEGKPIRLSAYEYQKKVILEVQDQGMGISEESQSRIFNRFERAVGTESSISGLGLGLYIVRQIIDAHHGSIRVESQLGQGSKFIVELPMKTEVNQLQIA